MYFWNDVHSVWLEASYQRVDYDRGGENHGWKLTLSQNIAIGTGAESHPMLRFYVPGGRVDNKHIAKVNDSSVERLHSLNVGGMFEAWFQVCRYLREQACAGLFAGSVDLIHRQAQGQILRIGIKVVLRLQVTIRVFRQIVLKQR